MSVETLANEASRALKLKDYYYATLGTPKEEQPMGPLSFEPWLERAKFERIMAADIPFRQEVDAQLIANLRERYHTATSITTYFLVGDRLRSALLPNEDFENVLLRGLEYRRQTGSNELVREEKEIEGFRQIQSIIHNPETAIGARIISLSPPGLVPDSPYSGRFVDIWEVQETETRERYGRATRFTTALDYQGYRQSALTLNPYYFADEEAQNLPLDAYFLSHPIPIPAQDQIGPVETLYTAFFAPDTKGMSEELFQEVLRLSSPVRAYFIDELCKDAVDCFKLAKAFNAYINVGDSFLGFQTKSRSEVKKMQYPVTYDQRYKDNINDLVNYWGMREVMTIAAGCGPSGGFKLRFGRLTSLGRSLLNSVSQFASKNGAVEEEGGVCMSCGEENLCTKKCHKCGGALQNMGLS